MGALLSGRTTCESLRICGNGCQRRLTSRYVSPGAQAVNSCQTLTFRVPLCVRVGLSVINVATLRAMASLEGGPNTVEGSDGIVKTVGRSGRVVPRGHLAYAHKEPPPKSEAMHCAPSLGNRVAANCTDAGHGYYDLFQWAVSA